MLLHRLWGALSLPDNVRMNGAADAGQAAEASKVLECRKALRQCVEVAEAANLNPNSRKRGSRASARGATSGDTWCQALSVLEELRVSTGRDPDSLSQSTAIAACAAGGRWAEVLQLLASLAHPEALAPSPPVAPLDEDGTPSLSIASFWNTAEPTASPGASTDAADELPDVAEMLASVEASLAGCKLVWRQALELLPGPKAAVAAVRGPLPVDAAQRLAPQRPNVPLQVDTELLSGSPAFAGGYTASVEAGVPHPGGPLQAQPSVLTLSGAIEKTCRGGQWHKALQLLDDLRHMMPTQDVAGSEDGALQPLTSDQRDSLFSQLDVNRDGFIDRRELSRALQGGLITSGTALHIGQAQGLAQGVGYAHERAPEVRRVPI